MIFQITYLSNDLRVKGYLALPESCNISTEEIQAYLEQYYRISDFPVELLACRRQQPIASQDSSMKRWPIFIYCRGGIGKVGSVKLNWLEQFASYNHVVFAPAYRGNEGGEGRDEFGGADQEDVHAACRWLQQLPFTNEQEISIMGFSRGSINAAREAAEYTGIRRLILWGGVTDLAKTYEERVDLRRMLKRVIGGNPAKVPESYALRSPLQMAKYIVCPVLIMHGTDDQQVSYHHGLDMYHLLKLQEHDVTMHTFDGLGHHLPAPEHHTAIANMFAWIEQQTTSTPES